jgi:filamentous hemagglutinin
LQKAAELAPSHIKPDQQNVTVDRAPNGVTIVNIAPANPAGVSHNKYQDFNVNQHGAVLNNSNVQGQSKLGGQILGNPNLNGNAPASLIINEVTGLGKSTLEGYTEVFGNRADYILANPNGITCRGCGFINMGRATLSTGQINRNEAGNYLLDVEQGQVSIEKGLADLGLDANDVDYFDIVSRTAVINGEIHAKDKDVAIHAGRQTYDYAARESTAKADNGEDKPELGIDSSALGGIYAGRIRLVGTEAGVGVKSPK